jgi:hypothetical protein
VKDEVARQKTKKKAEVLRRIRPPRKHSTRDFGQLIRYFSSAILKEMQRIGSKLLTDVHEQKT